MAEELPTMTLKAIGIVSSAPVDNQSTSYVTKNLSPTYRLLRTSTLVASKGVI